MNWILEKNDLSLLKLKNDNCTNYNHIIYHKPYNGDQRIPYYVIMANLPKYLNQNKSFTANYNDIQTSIFPILYQFSQNCIGPILGKLWLTAIDITYTFDRIVITEDTIHVYNDQHDTILIGQFARNGCRFWTRDNYAEMSSNGNSLKLQIQIGENTHQNPIFLNIANSLILELQESLNEFYRKQVKNDLKPFWEKLPVD